MSATESLSPLDATFLELEDADPTAHMHIGGVLVFDALPGGGTPTLTRVRRHVERRLEALPRYRQRLTRRTTGGLRWPEWEADDRFDI
ncbi:MAG TPA: wax ester/triacylglycerol synthase domain-containing protein, partial [Solirubrobacteraceae bacterium]|nr:wax ester/triacylglycerol synthase domain-containing protein [Solirubrobacteraceae bacterium]